MIDEILEADEKLEWSTPMRFVRDDTGYDDLWVKDTLYFTNKRLIWSIQKRGLFSKKIIYDDIPYRAVGNISKEQSPRSGGFSGLATKFKGGGTILVSSAVGSRQFQFGDEDTLRKAERFLRQILIGN